MKRVVFRILTTLIVLISVTLTCVNAQITPVQVECEVPDGSIIVADVYYPVTKKAKYSTIILLHSLGYNSSRWSEFAESLADAGFGVVAIDFRGHGKSVYTAKLNRQSWANYKREVFKKYPDDVIAILRQIKEEQPKLSFDEWGIVGADIGSNTAVLVAEKVKNKPKTIVLVSPHETYKGLFIPIALVNVGKVPVLTVSSTYDKVTLGAQKSLERYAQADFVIKNFDSYFSGMLMLNNPEITTYILSWLESRVAQYK